MSLTLRREAPLFEGSLPVRVHTAHNTERKLDDLTVRVLAGSQTSDGKTSSVLCIEIADPKDPFFLHSTCFDAKDYLQVARENGITEGFEAFPTNFIDYLRQCEPSDDSDSSVGMECGLSVESPTESRLHIVQITRFKHTTLLTLRMRPGTDTDVKRYLAGRLGISLDRESRLLARLQEETSLHTDAKHAVERLAAQLRESEEARGQLESTLRVEASKSLSELREKATADLAATISKHQDDIRERDSAYAAKLEALEARARKAEVQVSELSGRKVELESSLATTSAELRATKNSLQAATIELERNRELNNEHSGSRVRQEKELTTLRLRVESLEQEVRDKTQVALQTAQLLDAEKSAHSKLDEQYGTIRESYDTLNKKLEIACGEIRKGNDIIGRSREEIKRTKAKYRAAYQVVQEKERMLIEKERQIAELERKVQEVRDEIRNVEADIKKERAAYGALEEKHKSIEVELTKKDELIAYLNRTATDEAIAKSIGAQSRRISHAASPDAPRTMSPWMSSLKPTSLPASILHSSGGTSFRNVSSRTVPTGVGSGPSWRMTGSSASPTGLSTSQTGNTRGERPARDGSTGAGAGLGATASTYFSPSRLPGAPSRKPAAVPSPGPRVVTVAVPTTTDTTATRS